MSPRSAPAPGVVLVAVFVCLLLPTALQAEESACITCHSLLPDDLGAPLESWAADVHGELGLSCHSCHGGNPSAAHAEDPEASMSADAGYVGKPDRLQIADFCARCHSDATFMKRYDPQARVDQLTEYRSSVHGRRNQAGDPKPATCIDCHGVHGILPVSSPNSPVHFANVPDTCARCHADQATMAPYGTPTDQYEEYQGSMHAVALLERGDSAAPACNDCHGNHGAAPPGVESVANVCGQCHGREASLFRASFKKDLFDLLEVSECTACHDPHRVLHPTPELFRGASAPWVSQGTVQGEGPFSADLGTVAAGAQVEARWEVVLRPHLEARDPRLAHTIRILADGMEPLTIEARVAPGDPAEAEPRTVIGESFQATLTIEPLSGSPVQAGDALGFHLQINAGVPVNGLRVEDHIGKGLQPLAGSVCLQCHSPGDTCDVATEKMYGVLSALDRELRQASEILHRAEIAGMEVSGPKLELKTQGISAGVEARALIHTFDPELLMERVAEGTEVAAAAHEAGVAALGELEFRRQGLAVSLLLILVVLVALFLKIRQADRERQ